VDANRLWAFAGVAFVVILFPGPSVLFIISRSLSLGRVAALITVGANALGEFVQVVAVAFGIGALVAASTVAFITVKLLGAAYLIYLGIQTIRRARRGIGPAAPASASAGRHRVLWQGIVVGLTNPKTMVFFAAVLPQFVVVKLGHVPLQLLILGLVWVVIALVSDTAWALAASAARAGVITSQRRFRRLQIGSGAVIAGLGVGVALTSRSAS